MRQYTQVPRGETERIYSFNPARERCSCLSLGVCGCCGALRPRYKRLVDNIFPEDPKDGLVKADMEKLTFYAVSAPEKLDRIGTYLSERLSRDVVRHRYGHFLALSLLEFDLPHALQVSDDSCLAYSTERLSASLIYSSIKELKFVKFANIEEDTPSYHRRYDFFVSRFSAMCHSCHDNLETRTKIRVAGIRGIQGVVRKTVNDELQAIIWEPQHMHKIVPSLLFNMQGSEDGDSRNGAPSSPTNGDKEENPATLAENCFRELLGRAAYGNMNNALKPLLVHLDSHGLWDPNEFSINCFKIIMYSIQAQHSHRVIQQILGHLDHHRKSSPRLRAGIVQVLLETVAIAAKGSVGPTVLEVFNTLLKHLRMSVDFELSDRRSSSGSATVNANSKESDERIVQNAIIQTIGFFGSNLPDYQRAEIMMFIMGKVPVVGTSSHILDTNQLGDHGTQRIQVMLLRSLLMVTSGYKAKTINAALPALFLDPLLSLSVMDDSELRQLVLEILNNLVDRHDNRAKLRGIRIIPDVSALKIKREKIPRQDVSFMKKHGQQLYKHIYLGCKIEDNVEKNFELLYTTLALITIELANEEVIIDLIRLAIALQDMAILNEDSLSTFNRCGVMALVAAYLNFLSQMISIPAFCQHVSKVIETRHADAPYFLPENIFREKYSNIPRAVEKLEKDFIFLPNVIAESLGGSGYSVDRLSVPYVPQVTVRSHLGKPHYKCRQESTDEDNLSRRKSIVDTVSIQVDLLSGQSQQDKTKLAEEITFEALKKAIDATGLEEQEKERRRQVIEKFQKAPFEEIAANCESKSNMLHEKLAQILDLTIRPPPSPSGALSITAGHNQYQSVPVYEMKFPDLCVY
ncbi:protein EFR3 homolog A [Protopterus annectens]|uniref:protein EFR3 homolog A n=1 Tax=Protopterus annectens TaxID=7888 RepID=UPI001CFACC59|nr:protein EFR3 homolog A [Protopterus annectens]